MRYFQNHSRPVTRTVLGPIPRILRGVVRKLGSACLLGALCPLHATEYFVSNTGQDSNPGTDSQSAFQTIQHGVDTAKPGDMVTVMDGNYHESVNITHSGAKDAPITIRSQNRWGAKVVAAANQDDCFSIGGRALFGISYITIQGFDVRAASTYGTGVASYAKSQHITVENVYAHDCGSSGVGFGDGDYLVARNCVCSYNAFRMPYCGSGISLYGRFTTDDAPGFHNIVSGNICYGNNNGPRTMKTDGDGIIIDDHRNIQKYHNKEATFQLNYKGDDTLVENNLCFHNGGKGIIIYSTNNVTLVNNTCVRNMRRENQGGQDCGEISIGSCANVVLANNIAVTSTKPGDPLNHPNVSCYGFVKKNGGEYPDDTTMQGTITMENDLSFDENNPGQPSFYEAPGLKIAFAGENGNLAGVDANLIDPDDAILWAPKIPPDTNFAAYFGLQKRSPAIGAGIKIDGSSLAGQKPVDLGAFQQSPVR